MTVEFTINGVNAKAEDGESLLDVIRRYGFEVPSLCHHHELEPYGACRVCLISVTDRGRTKLTTSCNFQVKNGIEVVTDTEEIRRNRALVIELALAEAPDAEPLKKLGAEYGVLKSRFEREDQEEMKAERDGCILCGLCVRTCAEVVEVNALTFKGRGDRRAVGAPYMETPQNCIACGACAYICPTDCIGFVEEDGMRKLKKWNRELPIAKDENGNTVAPKFQLHYFTEKLGLPKDFYKKGKPGSV